MKFIVALAGIFIASGVLLSYAGSVLQFGNAPQALGTLTLTSASIHVDGSSSSDVNLPDVLEANFGDAPFHLDYFSSAASPDQLSPDFKGQDIGHPALAGSSSYAKGVLTLTGAGTALQRHEDEDKYYVFGTTLAGNGQITAELEGVDGQQTQAGLMLRQDFSELSPMFSMALDSQANGLFRARYGNTGHAGWTNLGASAIPVWMRLTRSGESIDAEISSDGQKWELINQVSFKTSPPSWLGLFLDTFSEKIAGKAVFDHLAITPGPSESDTLPPGVLLKSGSFISGSFTTQGATNGELDRGGKKIALSLAQISAVITHPLAPKQINAVADQTGLIMKNGDFLAADIQSLQGGYVIANSLVLGIASYYDAQWCACVFQPVKVQPSDYEVRLKDGSIIQASSLNVDSGQVTISEVTGASIDAALSEVAQVRAGTSKVQNLLSLSWIAKAAPGAAAPSPSSPPPAATSTNTAPPPAAPPAAGPEVQTCAGPNQEQILVLPAGTLIEFPLTGKFNGLDLHFAVTPDAPATAKVSLHFFIDGRDAGTTPAIKVGDAPSLIQLPFTSAQTITIEADSDSPVAKVLLIDPVATRLN